MRKTLGILTQILFAFPIKEINIKCQNGLPALIKITGLKDIFAAIKSAAEGIELVREVKWCSDTIGECKHVVDSKINSIDLGKGKRKYRCYNQ